MSIPTPPMSYVRVQSFSLDDEGTFTSPTVITLNSATNKWSFSVMSFHVNQLDDLATAIERLLLQDFADGLEVDSFNVDAALDVDGVTVLNPAFSVSLSQVNDAPGAYTIGTATNVSIGLAWSLRTAIRTNLGVGSPYVP